MSFDRAKARLALATGIAKLMSQGLLVEDVIEALRLAVREHHAQAGGVQNHGRREELLLFYTDADSILREATRRVEKAGKSAKHIAGT